MAAVMSLMLEVVVVAPVVLCGVETPDWCADFLACLVFTFGRSDIRLPEADGGSLPAVLTN